MDLDLLSPLGAPTIILGVSIVYYLFMLKRLLSQMSFFEAVFCIILLFGFVSCLWLVFGLVLSFLGPELPSLA